MDMKKEEFLVEAYKTLEVTENKVEDVSDGYHTFKELYHHRAILFSVICNLYNDMSWKSKKHDDGSMYDGMFIVGINTPSGQATYHYDIDPYWDKFNVVELEKAPKYDGHTPEDSLKRLEIFCGLTRESIERNRKLLNTNLLKSFNDNE